MEENNLIFGIRSVMEALKAGKEIDKILIKKDLQGELAQELFAAVKGMNIFTTCSYRENQSYNP